MTAERIDSSSVGTTDGSTDGVFSVLSIFFSSISPNVCAVRSGLSMEGVKIVVDSEAVSDMVLAYDLPLRVHP